MEQLFVYGTLKDPLVQKKVIGKAVQGILDILEGFAISRIKLGNVVYPILIRKNGSEAKGLVISVTPKELKLIDDYETNAYERQKAVLKSGKAAWAYVEPVSFPQFQVNLFFLCRFLN